MKTENIRTSQSARAGGAFAPVLAGCLIPLAGLLAPAVQADSRTQAYRMYSRIAGTPPPAAVLNTMAADIAGGNPQAAAQVAVQAASFYNVVLKNMVTPWTNRAQTVFAPLNDYTATVIGMVRDDLPFNTALSDDILYVGPSSGGIPAPSPANNNHYAALETQGVDLKANLTRTTQSATYGIPVAGTAGLLTTRAAASAFFIAGTNRAMFRFTMINHFCEDLDQLNDVSRPPDRVRQDVSRSPGGDSRIFLNSCVGCHAGMDPLTQAFASYNYDETAGALQYTPGAVQPKYLINSANFKFGYVTKDDHWDNYWRVGQNQVIGWDPALPGSGSGAKTMGQELAASDRFAQCQVQKVFTTVCFRAPANAADRAQIATMKTAFKANGYKMKQVFADAGVYCMGD